MFNTELSVLTLNECLLLLSLFGLGEEEQIDKNKRENLSNITTNEWIKNDKLLSKGKQLSKISAPRINTFI